MEEIIRKSGFKLSISIFNNLELEDLAVFVKSLEAEMKNKYSILFKLNYSENKAVLCLEAELKENQKIQTIALLADTIYAYMFNNKIDGEIKITKTVIFNDKTSE